MNAQNPNDGGYFLWDTRPDVIVPLVHDGSYTALLDGRGRLAWSRFVRPFATRHDAEAARERHELTRVLVVVTADEGRALFDMAAARESACITPGPLEHPTPSRRPATLWRVPGPFGRTGSGN